MSQSQPLPLPLPTLTLHPELQKLLDEGLHRHHPARFKLLESLAQRCSYHQGKSRDLLEEKLQQHIHSYRQYCKQLENPQPPDTEFKGFSTHRREFIALTEQLLGVTEQNNRHSGQDGNPLESQLNAQEHSLCEELLGKDSQHGRRMEFKSIAAFRDTWNRQHAEQLVDTSITQGPRDAGPLNPERLAISSLSAMQDLSTPYLKRFVSYIETLLWLQEIEKQNAAPAKKK